MTTSPRDYPLLAGVVRAYTGGSYLGAYALEETGPGVEWTIPFGVDNRIEVVRVPEPGMTSQEGFSGRQRQIRKQERTIVHNLTQRDVTLLIEDRLPVSEDERIVVEIAKSTTPGYRDSEHRPGVKLWTFDIEAGAKREVALDYTVRYPRNIDLRGLD